MKARLTNLKAWKICAFYTIMGAVISSCSTNTLTFEASNFQIVIGSNGQIIKLANINTETDFFPEGQSAPILAIRVNKTFENPSSMNFDGNTNSMKLDYEKSGVQAVVSIVEKETHIVFELQSISPEDKVDLVIWGPYPTTISKTIGECVGVVRDDKYAIGIQTLNLKTLGGYPETEDDVMPSYNIFEGDNLSDIGEDKRDKELYRGNTAKATDFGSTLQAYCRNRSKNRVISNWGHERYVAPAYDDGGLVGSKIAIFGCSEENALTTIGKIEVEERLPHPMIDGVWGKESPGATASYLIIGFGEENLDQAIDLTKKAGLRYLYHGGPFENWGHFKLNEKQFPDNWASMQRCVVRAEDEGVLLGVHTLSNFITTNDPYVSPVPDHRLATVGTSQLVNNINDIQTTITIKSPDYFNQYKNNNLHTVRIGDELIRYGKVSESEPWTLTDCERGAFGTKPSRHEQGEEISKLMDHGYKTFLTNMEMQDEVAETIARLFNETGLRQISFDGLEGCWATGMGQYGRTLFANKWYESLNDKLKGKVINDASNPGHYFWHIYTRMNWGEPWYAGFRESQTQYRLKNQNFYNRNLMPHMLGWFSMKPETSIEDAEWLLARAAGFDAGFALVTSPGIVKINGSGEEIINAINQWEKARMGEVFNEEQKELMRSVSNEFHLDVVDDASWNLKRVFSEKFSHSKKVRQPGEPVFSKFTFQNNGKKQPLQFIITAKGSEVANISMEIDNHKQLDIPVSIQPGQSLKYSGADNMIIYDMAWQPIKEIKMKQDLMLIENGEHNLVFDCEVGKGDNAEVKVELRTEGQSELISMK